MKTSESIKELSTALANAQAELRNPYNTADNPYFKSKYAPLPDILNLIRPTLAKHGLAVVQSPVTADGETGVEAMIIHSSGEYIIFDQFLLHPAKNDPQTAGGAITYARRYSLNAILGISGEEDDDGNDASTPAPNKPKEKPVICPMCGKPVKAAKGKAGVIQPAQVLEQLGMCASCYKEIKNNCEENKEG